MTLEIDTSILSKIDNITLNQLVFLNLVLNKESIEINQDIMSLISLVNDSEIQDLIERNLIIKETIDSEIVFNPTEELMDILGIKRTMFDEFYETFPAIVNRPDGLKGFLRGNLNKSRKLYSQIIGRSRVKHEHIMRCLRSEISYRISTNNLGYMKTMWKWLTNAEWEVSEDRLREEQDGEQSVTTKYGTDVI